MIEIPEVRYARNGSVSLAYQVVGDGPIDVVEVSGIFTHLEAKWDEPGLTRSVADLARFARVILFDRRGVGLSDRTAGEVAPTLDELVSDIRAVMEAAGSYEAVVLAVGDGGIPATAFAVKHPEATRALVLYNSVVLPPTQGVDEESFAHIEREWGTGAMAARMGSEELRSYFARVERRACTPHAAKVMFRALFANDLESVLPSITAPTLVLQYRDHPNVSSEAARKVATAIPGARYVEMPGYSIDGQVRERRGLATAIEEFVTGAATVTDADRVLAGCRSGARSRSLYRHRGIDRACR